MVPLVVLLVAGLNLQRIATERFTGGLMGVSADVTLCMASKHAQVKLWGLPLGGALSGTARFSEGEGSSVQISEPLNSQLKRRFVKIVGARFDRAEDKVYVIVKLPLILGTQRITLYRATTSEPVSSGLDCVF